VAEVSIVTAEEYAALVLRAPAPEVNDAIPSPQAPDTPAEAPELPTTDSAPAVARPDPVEEPPSPRPRPRRPRSWCPMPM
jgi:hypothetical protein